MGKSHLVLAASKRNFLWARLRPALIFSERAATRKTCHFSEPEKKKIVNLRRSLDGIRYILEQTEEPSVSVPTLYVGRYIILEGGGNTCLIQFQEHASRRRLNFSFRRDRMDRRWLRIYSLDVLTQRVSFRFLYRTVARTILFSLPTYARSNTSIFTKNTR